MGHGQIVIADGFSAAHCLNLSGHGHGVAELCKAILTLFPWTLTWKSPRSDTWCRRPDQADRLEEYRTVLRASGEKFTDFEFVDRFKFYERAKKAFAVISTSEGALYANIILKKGVVA